MGILFLEREGVGLPIYYVKKNSLNLGVLQVGQEKF